MKEIFVHINSSPVNIVHTWISNNKLFYKTCATSSYQEGQDLGNLLVDYSHNEREPEEYKEEFEHLHKPLQDFHTLTLTDFFLFYYFLSLLCCIHLKY